MIQIKKLSCGVTLVSEYMPTVKSLAMGIWVKAGAVYEKKEVAGISHFIEHMLFKGTERRSAKEIAEDVDKIGAQINAFTGKEATCYYIKSLESNWVAAIDIIFDMFLKSVFDEEEMEREKQVIYEEMKMIQDTPDEYVHDLICENVFSGMSLANSIIGTKDSLQSIKREDILRYVDDRYTGSNIVFSVAGNFDIDRITEFVENKFSDMKNSASQKDKTYQLHVPSYMAKSKDIKQAHICLGVRSIPLDHSDYYSFSVLNNIMGGTMSSRFFQNIREQKGLAYSVYSMNSSFAIAGYYNIYAGVSKDKIQETIDAIREELTILGASGVTDAELSKAKEQIKSSYIFGQENVNSRMFSIGKNTTLLGKVKSGEEVLRSIEAVKVGDVERVSSLISNIKNYSGVVIAEETVDLDKIIKG